MRSAATSTATTAAARPPWPTRKGLATTCAARICGPPARCAPGPALRGALVPAQASHTSPPACPAADAGQAAPVRPQGRPVQPVVRAGRGGEGAVGASGGNAGTDGQRGRGWAAAAAAAAPGAAAEASSPHPAPPQMWLVAEGACVNPLDLIDALGLDTNMWVGWWVGCLSAGRASRAPRCWSKHARMPPVQRPLCCCPDHRALLLPPLCRAPRHRPPAGCKASSSCASSWCKCCVWSS